MRFIRKIISFASNNQANNMTLKFCANLSFMFNESPDFLERYRLAKKAGFWGVESGFPPNDVTLEQLVKVKNETGLEQILLNISTGSVVNGQFGCASFPGEEEAFQKNLQTTLGYAKALNCKKIHLMAGKLSDPVSSSNDEAYLKNLKYAAKELENANIVGLIEVINPYAVPGFYLNNYDKAISILKQVNSPNLKLMLDLFHIQLIRGNITNFIEDNSSWIGHVQIAQVPDRHEPNTEGELNLKYILNQLELSGYTDWVGCEYKPKSGSAAGLGWVREFGYTL